MSARRRAESKRQRKKLRVLMSMGGIMVGFLIAQFFAVTGFWTFSAVAWWWSLATTVLVHGFLWLVLHLGWDERLTWDPHFLYLPWTCVILLFCLFIVVAPEARVLIPFGFFINLMFLVGLVGFRVVVLFSLMMSGGYLATAAWLRSQGEPLALGYEILVAGLLLALGAFSGTVLEQAKRRRERALRDAAELHKLSRAVEQSPGLVLITDTEGRIEYVNPKFTAVTGYELGEVVGKTPAILKSLETPETVYKELWSQLKLGGEWHGEFKNLKCDGEPFWVTASISPIRDADGEITHYLAVEEDVTERKKVEARLVQAQKLEGVGQLVSGVAHDFNNLLTGVLGFAELALRKVDGTDPVRTDLHEIQKAGKSATALTRQLLAFSRQQMLRPEVLDLNQVVTDLEILLRRTVTEKVEVTLELDRDLGPTEADPVQIQQILMNLALNARDAMPAGGRLSIATGNVELTSSHAIEPVEVRPGNYVSLRVTDTGCGMDEETRRRVFEPFFTTKERGRGTGLGLATVYGIVKQSRGYIWVTSSLGAGTTIEVQLPLHEGVQGRSAGAGVESMRKLPGGAETILLVEDDDSVRRFATQALEGQGYQVLIAENPLEALALTREQEIDLVISDIVMPGLDGVELTERVRKLRPEARVLLISGYAEQRIVEDTLADPATPFLGKPFSIGTFLDKVRELLDGPA